MEKHYLVKTTQPFDPTVLFSLLAEAGVDTRTISFSSPTEAEFVAPVAFYAELYQLLKPFHDDIGGSVSILIAHQHTSFEERLLEEALAYFPNSCVFPSDVIMKEVGYDNYDSYGPLMDLFRPISGDFDLLEAAKAYLACGLDACLAAKTLFVHRNTFSYRLNAFVEKTGVDIRDYHNALLFEIYLQFKGKR